MKSRHEPNLDPYWRRAHHDWRFWVGLGLMLAAIAMYVLSNDLSLVLACEMYSRHSAFATKN